MFFAWRVSIFTVTNPDDNPHGGGGPYRARGLIDCHPPIIPRLPSPLPDDDRLLETAGVDVPNGIVSKILLSPAKRALSK
jgi:hypothetical protein